MDYNKVLKKIFVGKAHSSDHQTRLIREAPKLIKNNNIKLVVVDSLIGHFRSEYIGTAKLLQRQQKLEQHMIELHKLLKSFKDLVVVVFNQVTYNPHLKINKPAGGGTVYFYSSIIIELLREMRKRRIAKIIEAPHLPNDVARFNITDDGIRDFNVNSFEMG